MSIKPGPSPWKKGIREPKTEFREAKTKKSGKEENQRLRDEAQRFRDEVASQKEKEIRLTVENDFLKRRDEEWRLERNTERAERNADRAMFQTIISNVMNGMEDRKRKRNGEEEMK